jgi:DNA-binding NarL/FixJ family response regulator
MSAAFRTRVLVAEDEEFTLNLLREILSDANFEVIAVNTIAGAIEAIEEFDPHAVVTDLNFGINAPNGADLLNFLDAERPWIGKVILTSHASANLALPRGTELPKSVIYLVKSELETIAALSSAVHNSIAQMNDNFPRKVTESNRIIISESQGEILRMLAQGLTNAAISSQLGTSLRATESLVQRTFLALGLKSHEDFNSRILAVRMWQEDKVVIR